ncbi:MAG: class I mannose-6-phosphate isomerase [Bacteriovoracaceae bacterium]|nr:class I mannose-6-phosphate isomerase [Bacteriovoracaceae bacterium]
MVNSKTLLKLSPYYVEKVWGGNKLKSLKADDSLAGKPIGEAWEVSIHPDGPSMHNNIPLPNDICFPYLVKFIDTSDNLSVQVHPDDDYAGIHENSSGKTECWLILDCAPGEGIYLGMKDGVTKETFEEGLRAGSDMQKFLKFRELKRGDFFYVPAGSIHAIGKGVTLCEIQQSSGITYRVWDWNRIDDQGNSRDLHIDKAMDVLNFDPKFNQDKNFKIQTGLLQFDETIRAVEHPQFIVDVVNVSPGKDIVLSSKENRPSSIIMVEGNITVSRDDETFELSAYQSMLVLNPEHRITISSIEGAKYLWVS